MILVDTSVIVAWLDKNHEAHKACTRALASCASRDTLAVSSVTYAELACGARNREGVDEALKGFERLKVDFSDAWRPWHSYWFYPRRTGPGAGSSFFVRSSYSRIA